MRFRVGRISQGKPTQAFKAEAALRRKPDPASDAG